MPAKKRKIVDVKWASQHEFDCMVESRARRVLKISASKFISKWKQGKYRKLDSDTCPGVVELAILAPLPRNKSGRKTPKDAADYFVRFLRESLSCLSEHYLTAFQQSEKLYKVYYEPYAEVMTTTTRITGLNSANFQDRS